MEPLDYYLVPITLSIVAAVLVEALRQTGAIGHQQLPAQTLAIAAAVEIVWLLELLSRMDDDDELTLTPLFNHPAPMTDGGILLMLSGCTFVLWLVLLAMKSIC